LGSNNWVPVSQNAGKTQIVEKVEIVVPERIKYPLVISKELFFFIC